MSMSQPIHSDIGQLILISAPSGAGKTSLVHKLLEADPEICFSISHTTRPPRPREVEGEDYFFVDKAEFDRLKKAGEFLEYACVFDHWYGTGKTQVARQVAAGRRVVLEIDWQGARQVRAARPECTSIFIVPPSVAELERRLRGRGTDAEPVIVRRLQDSLADLSHWSEFDHVVVNDDLDVAATQLAAIVRGDASVARTDNPAVAARIGEILAAT